MGARGRLIVVAGALLAFAPAAANAQDERAVARTLFEEGRALAKDGKWTEACAKFDASEKASPGIGTLFNLADCWEHVGKTASAWAAFSEVVDQAKRAGQADREAIARDRAAALAPKLAKIRIDAKDKAPAGLELRLDGKALAAGAIGSEMPVDPGDHELTVSAPGKTTKKVPIRVEVAAATVLVDLPKLDDAVAPAPVQPAFPPPVQEERTWQRPAAIGVGAAAIVALGVGTFFGLRASSQWSDAKATCTGNTCDDKGYSGWQDARSSATIGTIGFIAGGVLAAGAVVLWITAPRSSASVGALR